MSNRLSNAAIFNEAVYKPMKLITNPVVVMAGILMAALMLASTFSVSAQDARSYRYNERGTAPVATFATDRPVEWTLAGADAGDFKITEGVTNRAELTFANTPNFEAPADADTNNVYLVDIVASGTTLVNATVTVLNVDDPGKVTLDHLQPAEDVTFTASVADEDDGEKTAATDDGNTLNPASPFVEWKWERSQSGTSGWAIISGQAGATYTPKTEDVGYYLRATASYSNRNLSTSPVPTAPVRTASARSVYQVKATTNVNQAPVFPDGDEDVADKQQDRTVNENDKNALVGGAVSAKDAGDVLEYSWADLDHN